MPNQGIKLISIPENCTYFYSLVANIARVSGTLRLMYNTTYKFAVSEMTWYVMPITFAESSIKQWQRVVIIRPKNKISFTMETELFTYLITLFCSIPHLGGLNMEVYQKTYATS